MGIGNRFDGIDEYAVRLIKFKARQLIGKYGFSESNQEDLEQKLLLKWLQHRSKYDPNRAQLNTFTTLIIENAIASIIEERTAAKRDYRLCSCSLNDRLEDEEGNTIERMETIDQEDYLRRTGRLSRPTAEVHDLSIDTNKAMETLPPELRELCQRLKSETVTEISCDTGIPRSTIYESKNKLRAIFEDAGLRDYL